MNVRTYSLEDFAAAFGDNYLPANLHADPLSVAMCAIDDMRRVINLCSEAMHAERDDDPIPSAVREVLVSAYIRSGAALGVLDKVRRAELAERRRFAAPPSEDTSLDVVPMANQVTELLSRVRHTVEGLHHQAKKDPDEFLRSILEIHDQIGTAEMVLDEIRENAPRAPAAKSDVRASAPPEGPTDIASKSKAVAS